MCGWWCNSLCGSSVIDYSRNEVLRLLDSMQLLYGTYTEPIQRVYSGYTESRTWIGGVTFPGLG